MKHLIAFLIVTTGWGSLVAAQTPAPVRVYVTSVGAQKGFSDPSPDNRDIVKNLVDDIKGKRELQIAESPEDAAIVLTVLGRESQVGRALLGSSGHKRTVAVRFQVGDIQTDLTASAENLATWSRVTGKIVDQVVDWVKSNRARLP